MRPHAWRIILGLSTITLLAVATTMVVWANHGATNIRLPLAAIHAQQQEPGGEEEFVHVVGFGDTLAGIARLYNLNIDDIIALNELSNPNFIFVGQRLRLPPGIRTHIVRPGDTLASIARTYNVNLRDLLRINNVNDPNLLYVDQRLLLPAANVTPTPALPPEVTATPTPSVPTATPTAQRTPQTPLPTNTPTPKATPVAQTGPSPTPGVCLCPTEEEIIITGPVEGITVTSPILVTGIGAGFEQSLSVRVLDEAGQEVGIGYVSIAGEMGQRGPFTGTVSYRAPFTTQWGRVQVFSVSPRDGAIEHLNSVSVRLLGSDIEAFFAAFKVALETKDYTVLEALMLPDSFLIGFYLSEGVTLTPSEAIAQLRENYLGPGTVSLVDEVDGWQLLGDRASFGPTVRLVLYSTGWGPEAADDAFLVFEERDGEYYWTAMLYVRDELRDYAKPVR